jgi:hypothetical protein
MVDEAGLGTQVGFRPPMPAREAFALARTLVVPSRAESMPYIVLEAAAAVAADRHGCRRHSGDPHGESEQLVPPGDADALAPRCRGQERGRKGCELRRCYGVSGWRKDFPSPAMATRIEAIYRGAVGTAL